MSYQIAILITTFLRDKLLYKTLQTIVENYTNNCIVLIADQGYTSEEKTREIDYIKSQIPCEYYNIPFDSGLSFGRNFLVKKAEEMNISYCLLSADSIQFTTPYNFNPFIDFLQNNSKAALIGFELQNSKCPWEFIIEVTPRGIKCLLPTEYITFTNQQLLKVDICRNIFLAKTVVLLDSPYDEELKLAEHELFFIGLKQRGWQCYWSDSLIFDRCSPRPSQEYEQYRKRFGDYLKIAKQKLGISGWIIYNNKKVSNEKNREN
jgi:hypothetical protein